MPGAVGNARRDEAPRSRTRAQVALGYGAPTPQPDSFQIAMYAALSRPWIRAMTIFVVAAVLFPVILDLLHIVWPGPAASAGGGAVVGASLGYLEYRRSSSPAI